MNAIIAMLVSAVVAAPFLAPSGTSAPTPQIVRRFGAIARIRSRARARRAPTGDPCRARARDLAAPFVAAEIFFAHNGIVAAPTAGRGLAQPAV
jgi:hypothetical protein